MSFKKYEYDFLDHDKGTCDQITMFVNYPFLCQWTDDKNDYERFGQWMALYGKAEMKLANKVEQLAKEKLGISADFKIVESSCCMENSMVNISEDPSTTKFRETKSMEIFCTKYEKGKNQGRNVYSYDHTNQICYYEMKQDITSGDPNPVPMTYGAQCDVIKEQVIDYDNVAARTTGQNVSATAALSGRNIRSRNLESRNLESRNVEFLGRNVAGLNTTASRNIPQENMRAMETSLMGRNMAGLNTAAQRGIVPQNNIQVLEELRASRQTGGDHDYKERDNDYQERAQKYKQKYLNLKNRVY